MNYDVRVEHARAGRPLAVVRRRAGVAELSRIIPQSCGVVWDVVRSRQVRGAGRHVAVYLDDKINLEVGVELETPFAGYGDVVGSDLPSGTVATATHFGPYDRLRFAREAVVNWCRSQGHALAGPSWEIYGHWIDEWNSDPSKIRTDVFHLIEPS